MSKNILVLKNKETLSVRSHVKDTVYRQCPYRKFFDYVTKDVIQKLNFIKILQLTPLTKQNRTIINSNIY